MKKFINKIRHSTILIAILLRCCFIICKSLILYDRCKISEIDLKVNIFEALDDSIFKAYRNDLIDDDKVFYLTDKLIKVTINL